MTRLVAVGLVVLGTLATALPAHAQESQPLPNNAVLDIDPMFFYIERKDGTSIAAQTAEEVRFALNGAHCSCGQANPGTQAIGYRARLNATTGLSRPVDVYVGKNCDDPQRIDDDCKQVDTIPSIDTIQMDEITISIPIYDAINVNTTGACDTNIVTATVWLMVDQNGDGTYETWYKTPIPEPAFKDDASIDGVDTKPPPLPEDVAVSAAEGTIQLSWDLPTDSTDMHFFQAQCAMLDDTAVSGVEQPEAKYQTTGDVCTIAVEVTPEGRAPGLVGEQPIVAAPTPFRTLDKGFLCGEAGVGATSVSITGLENNVPYKIGLVVSDDYGNFSTLYLTTTVTPRPVIDFWEDLNDRDSAIDGGCLLSTTYGDGNPLTQLLRDFRDHTLARTAFGRALIDAYYGTIGALAIEWLPARIVAGVLLAPFVAVALAWHYLTLPGLLALIGLLWLARRTRRRWRAVAAGAILAATAGTASADDFMPYWEDPAKDEPALREPDDVRWHVGIRVGPYIPAIDDQVGKNSESGLGPYEAMFGDQWFCTPVEGGGPDCHRRKQHVWQILPMLDVDRVVWRGFGQLAFGGTIGYMQRSGYAYAENTSPGEAERPRQRGARNTFRLIPFAATATYRLTYFDDRWGVPIVPYVRGGLAYYAWWLKAPNGDVGTVCRDEPDPENPGAACMDEDKAYGGSFGLQGAIGIAVRAERIDGDAARSMRNSGIQHAGFYGELSTAKVDGFGSSSKLSVGDTTWFAGVNFEF